MVTRETLDGFQGGLQIGGRMITNLRYADDIILLATLVVGRVTPYASVNHRRQSFSCRRRTRVERSAAARTCNIRILSVYFSQTSEDSSLPALLPLTVCVVPEQ